MDNQYDFSMEPGKNRIKIREYKKQSPVISVIIPFYNSKDYVIQTVISILNQTFPHYEILIIDDGSTDNASLKILEEVEKYDERIKVFHKKNEGLAATRDFGATKSAKTSKYLMFIDDDDLIEPTFLECAYWTLETNTGASWAYSDSLGFGIQEYKWNKYFDSEKMKKVNELISAAMVRKSDFLEVKGYGIREKAVNEDWNFWLKLMAKRKYPVHMSFYGQWYRRKAVGELKKSIENRKRSMEIINNTANKIKEKVIPVQYPRYNYNFEMIQDNLPQIVKVLPKEKEDGKINLLMIIPWMITGGADLFNLQLIQNLDKKIYTITIITTEPNNNVLRQKFEENDNVKVYDLTSFLDQKYWPTFVRYIIEKENINIIFNSNSKFGYFILPYLKSKNVNIPIIDYVHMEEWYNRNGGYSRYSTMYESVIDKTLVCNENSRKILINHFGKKAEEVETVYVGVDEKKFNPSKYEDKNKLQIKYLGKTTNKKIITYICRISEQKRPMLLLEIISKLKEKRNDFHVLVVGSGNLLPKMKERARKMRIIENIFFLGNINNTAEIYKISDVTINCSIKEGLALTSYESLSMGVPVISSDVGGQKELINDKVGKIIPILQAEEDIYKEQYKTEEILGYVNAVEEIFLNLDKYKKNCRKTILDAFTISNMVTKIEKNLMQVYNHPNKTKIKNAENLKNNENLTKELITINLKNDETEYKWECLEYEKNIYGKAYSAQGINYKKEIIKEKLWKNHLWRIFIKMIHKLRK